MGTSDASDGREKSPLPKYERGEKQILDHLKLRGPPTDLREAAGLGELPAGLAPDLRPKSNF
jgi:hypothetical protein